MEARTKTTRHAVNQGLDPQIAVDLDRDLQVTFTNCQRTKQSQKSSNGLWRCNEYLLEDESHQLPSGCGEDD